MTTVKDHPLGSNPDTLDAYEAQTLPLTQSSKQLRLLRRRVLSCCARGRLALPSVMISKVCGASAHG